MFYYYKYKNKVLFSLNEYRGFSSINEFMAKDSADTMFFLGQLPTLKSRMSFILSDASMFYLKEENIDLLNKPQEEKKVVSWIQEKIDHQKIVFINTEYANWESVLERDYPEKWRVNIIALGDIGSTLLTGLKLLGGNQISEIGLYDRNQNTAERWEFEMNQTVPPFRYQELPHVKVIREDQLMNCDMLVFCAAKGYTFDKNTTDVRMAQLEQNSEIIATYARKARDAQFKGIFAVLSDPVDLLSKKVYLESNKDASGHYDFKGLAPEQIHGFGLGVMNARALYYANKMPRFKQYASEGRAFGPHGTGLVIADSIDHYNDILSVELTDLAVKANIKMRKMGFKPYIAPALSSGAYSILATIAGEWHYSATFLGGVYMGANNRFHNGSVEVERLSLPERLYNRLNTTYKNLQIL